MGVVDDLNARVADAERELREDLNLQLYDTDRYHDGVVEPLRAEILDAIAGGHDHRWRVMRARPCYECEHCRMRITHQLVLAFDTARLPRR